MIEHVSTHRIGDENLIDAVKVFDRNLEVFADCINDNHCDIKDLYSSLEKLTKKKAGKFGVFLAVMAGAAYVVKNEIDKRKLRTKINTIDLTDHGDYPTHLESEGEATDPTFI